MRFYQEPFASEECLFEEKVCHRLFVRLGQCFLNFFWHAPLQKPLKKVLIIGETTDKEVFKLNFSEIKDSVNPPPSLGTIGIRAPIRLNSLKLFQVEP